MEEGRRYRIKVRKAVEEGGERKREEREKEERKEKLERRK